jgi:hypothetical protein
MARASFFLKACRCRSGDCRNLRRRKHFRSWNLVLPWTFESALCRPQERHLRRLTIDMIPDIWDSELISDTSSGE